MPVPGVAPDLRSGRLVLSDGALGRPSLSFRRERGSGLRRLAAGQVGLDILSITRLTVSANGLTVTGTVTATAGVVVNAGGLSVTAGGAQVAGNSGVTGTLTVSGTLTASGGLVVTAGGLTVVSGGATVSGGLQVSTGTLIVNAGATIGTLGVTGTLDVAGAATLNFGLTVNGGLVVGGGLRNTNGVYYTSAAFHGFYDVGGSATQPVKVGSLVASSSYSDVAPANGIYSAGAISSAAHTVRTGNLIVSAGDLSIAAGNAGVSGSITAGTGLVVSTGNLTVASGNLTISSGNLTITGGGINSPAASVNFFNGGAAEPVKVGSLVASSSYSDVAPANGIYSAGGISAAFMTLRTGGLTVSLGSISALGGMIVSGANLLMQGNFGVIASPVTGTPGQNGLYANNVPKAWAFVSSAGTLLAGFCIAGVTRNGTGLYTVDFQRAFTSTNYAVAATPANGQIAIQAAPNTASQAFINMRVAGSATLVDSGFSIVVFGDQ